VTAWLRQCILQPLGLYHLGIVAGCTIKAFATLLMLLSICTHTSYGELVCQHVQRTTPMDAAVLACALQSGAQRCTLVLVDDGRGPAMGCTWASGMLHRHLMWQYGYTPPSLGYPTSSEGVHRATAESMVVRLVHA
jgi:hypothetical protein